MSVTEEINTLTFTVSLSVASGLTVSVTSATANGTAVSSSDYLSKTGTLTIAPGETSKTITISILNNTLVEADETFVINLSNAINAVFADHQGLGTILNDD